MNDMVENIANEAKEMNLEVVEMPVEKKGIRVNKSYALGFVSGISSAIAARIVAKKIVAKIAAKKNKKKEEEDESEYLTVEDVQEMEEE